jgi:hypothetical protein
VDTSSAVNQKGKKKAVSKTRLKNGAGRGGFFLSSRKKGWRADRERKKRREGAKTPLHRAAAVRVCVGFKMSSAVV